MMKCLHLFFLAAPILCSAMTNQELLETNRKLRPLDVQYVIANISQFVARQKQLPLAINQDEALYQNLRGSYGKALAHYPTGFIVISAFQSLVNALLDGDSARFDQILLGEGTRKLANPQGSFAYYLAACDGWLNSMRAAPAFASAETAGEMVELYWTALLRDVPFNEFGTDANVANAIADLNSLSDFRGPKVGGFVTPATFLRGKTPGDLTGPYISQFLYQSIPYGSTTIPPEQTVPVAGISNDFLTNFVDWSTVINGGLTGESITYEGVKRFLVTPRDLAEYVHNDFPGQSFYNALLILNSYGAQALDPNNPYVDNPTQGGFVSYGIGQYLELLAEVVEEGLKAAWFHKWQVHRRLRPEEYGFYVQKQVADNLDLGIHQDLINSDALVQSFAQFGTYFLAQAYPEGSPTHPSYPAGHAVLSGACATLLKALFNEDFEIPNPLEPSLDNSSLVAYGGTLTVGDELNKLAANISLGRDHAGVHYRSDGIEGMLLGEKIALDVLNNSSFLNHENFEGFTLTTFEGRRVTVGAKR